MNSENAADLRALCDLIEVGRVTPLVDTVYELRDTAAAVRRQVDGHPGGKVVLAVREPDNG